MTHPPRKHADVNEFVTLIITADVFPRQTQHNARWVTDYTDTVSDTAVWFVFGTTSVPRVGSSSVFRTLVALILSYFTVFLFFTFSTCLVLARAGVGSLFCVHLKHLTNLGTGWIAASHQPLCFASLISHLTENILYYMVDVHRARTSLRTHPVTMATSINAQIFLPTWRVPFWEQKLHVWQQHEIGSNSVFRSLFAITQTYLEYSFCPKISCGSEIFGY